MAGGILLGRVLFIPFSRHTSPIEHLAIGAMSAGLFLLVAAVLRAWRLREDG